MQKGGEKRRKIGIAIVILAVLALISIILSAIVGLFVEENRQGNVALIKIEGPIVATKSGFFSDSMVSSDDVVELIKEAGENPDVKAVIFDINSPGGSAVASDEIGAAIKKLNKTTVAVIREIGASGGYWVASAAEVVFANRMSITGSIGVLGSYVEFAGLLERYNMTYQRLVSGKYKDIGSPLKELAPDERALMQGVMDEIYNQFIDEVAKNRRMQREDVEAMATGMFFTGAKAKELGLVDELGGMDEAKDYIEKKLNMTAEITEYKKPITFSDILSQIIGRQSFSVGQGIGSYLFADKTPISI